MGEFSKIDLSLYRNSINEGKETDHEGNHINKCEKGSIGRYIKDFQKTQYKLNEIPQSTNLPRSRSFLSMEYYKQEPGSRDSRGVWRVDNNPNNDDMRKEYDPIRHTYRDMENCRLDEKLYKEIGSIENQSVERRLHMLNHRGEKFYKENGFSQGGSFTDTKNWSSIGGDRISRFIERVTEGLFIKMRNMPLYITRALERFCDRANIITLATRANALEELERQSMKSSSEWIELIENGFYRIAEQYFKRNQWSIQYARDLAATNPEEWEIQNPRGLPFPIKPISAGMSSQNDDKVMEDEILDQANTHVSNLMMDRMKKDGISFEIDTTKYVETPPVGGTRFVRGFHQDPAKRRIYRIMKNKEENPAAMFDRDPESLYPRLQPIQQFDELLPKPQRERLCRILEKRIT